MGLDLPLKTGVMRCRMNRSESGKRVSSIGAKATALRFARTPESVFWAKVKRAGARECWFWQGARNTKGYGAMNFRCKTWSAHRLAWALTNGAAPSTQHVCHRCDNPSCVNPAHLFLGTNTENVGDRDSKNRQARGVKIWSTKLNGKAATKIRRLLAAGRSISDAASEFNVNRKTIRQIRDRKTWRYVA